jgi:uncharacterized protein YjiK
METNGQVPPAGVRPQRVFISYLHLDRDLARRLETALKAEHYEVTRDDRRFQPTTNWPRAIAQELAASDAVVLVWCSFSESSQWQRSEWLVARALGKPIVLCVQAGLADFAGQQPVPSELAGLSRIEFDRNNPNACLPEVKAALAAALSSDTARAGLLKPESALPERCFIPLFPNPDVIGRLPELRELYLAFHGEGRESSPRALVGLTGPAGVGKTTLAVEFALRFQPAFPSHVVWIDAAGNWCQEFARAARQLDLTVLDPDTRDAEANLALKLYEHLNSNPVSLVVMDGVASPAALDQEVVPGFKPTDLRCGVLYTTRQTESPPGAAIVNVGPLSEAEALKLLTRNIQLAADEEPAARELCRLVNGLPLALELAAAHREGQPGFADYVGALRDRLAEPGADALNVVIEQQQSAIRSEQALRLFKTMAQMRNGEMIPEARLALLTGTRVENPVFAAARDELLRLKLAQRPRDNQLRLHSRVHESAAQLVTWTETALFRTAAGKNLSQAYASLERLEDEFQLRGIDPLLGDFALGVNWCQRDLDALEFLSARLDLLEQERRNLGHELEQDATQKVSLLQQLLFRSDRLNLTALNQQVQSALQVRGEPYFLPTRFQPGATGKPVLLEHGGWVSAVAFSPDGRYVLSGSHDKTLVLRDAVTGEHIRKFEQQILAISAVAFSGDGRRLLSGSHDGSVVLWDIASTIHLRKFKGHLEQVNAVAFSPDGKFALSGSSDNSLILWDLVAGCSVRSFNGHMDNVRAVAFAPDGRTAISCGDDRMVILWNVADGRFIRTLEGHSDCVNSVVFVPGSQQVISAACDKTLIAWDVETGKRGLPFLGHTDAVWSVAVSRDGRLVVSGANDRSLILWDRATGRPLRRFFTESPVYSLAWHGAVIATGDHRGEVSFYELKNRPLAA